MKGDEQAIGQLVLRFADALTRGDAELFGSLWAERAVWRIGPPADTEVSGTPADLAAAVVERFARWRTFIQLVHGTVAEVDGDRATARSYLTELGIPSDGEGGYRNHGAYEDVLVREAGGWRFAERSYRYLYLDRAPLEGTGFGP